MATIEEAKECPKCGQAGKEVKADNLGRKGTAYTFHCQNEICPWLNTGWIVQVKPDGTIPERQQGPKVFEHLTSADKRIAEKIIQEVRRENEI